MGEEAEGFAVPALAAVEDYVFGNEFVFERLDAGEDCGDGVGEVGWGLGGAELGRGAAS